MHRFKLILLIIFIKSSLYRKYSKEKLIVILNTAQASRSMATFQGLGLTDQPIERERLDYASYFTSMVLAVYDNILGPTVLKVWVAKQPDVKHLGKITDFYSDAYGGHACNTVIQFLLAKLSDYS